jgi:hypothetical protein
MVCLHWFTSLIVWHFSVDSISKPISDTICLAYVNQEYNPSLSSISLKWNPSFKTGLMLSFLSLRRHKEVWVFIKDYYGRRPSSARTATLVELFFTPSVLLQKPRRTFSLIDQMNLHLVKSWVLSVKR